MNASFSSPDVPNSEDSTGLDTGDVEKMACDPILAPKLKAIQARAYDAIFTAIDDMIAVLSKDDPLELAGVSGGALRGASLALAARRATSDAKDRRAYAQALLTGALLNSNNPEWDPATPSTDRADYDNPIVTLMLMGPIGAN